jgi:hypothetical protein
MFFTNDLAENLRLSREVSQRPEAIMPGFALDGNGQLYLEHAPENRVDPRGTIRRRERGFRLCLKDLLVSQVVAFVQGRPRLVRLAQKLGVREPMVWMPRVVRTWYDDKIIEKGWPLTCALLRELQSDVESHGGKLALAVIPDISQVYETYRLVLRKRFPDDPVVIAFLDDPLRPQRLLRDFCTQEGLAFLDLEVVFRERMDDGNLYNTQDFHLSRLGHRVVGEALADLIFSLCDSTRSAEGP